MAKKRRKRNRTWQPRPSEEARVRILAAVRAVLADDWAGGFGVTLDQLVACGLSYSTMKNYLRSLVKTGDLKRVAVGVYNLP